MKVLGVLLDTLTFTSSFIKDPLQKDAWHVDLLIKMGDVQVAFGILIHCFMQHPSYFLWCTPPSSTFTKSLISFYSSFLQMFGHLLAIGSSDSPKRPLVHKQISLLITFNGVRLILISTIALKVYLGNWVLVVSVIIARFTVDQHPFLFETFTQVNNNTFPFQQHFKTTYDLLPPLVCAYPFPFE